MTYAFVHSFTNAACLRRHGSFTAATHGAVGRPSYSRGVTYAKNKRATVSASLGSALTSVPFSILAENEKLYADIIKGSFGIILATFASTVVVGLLINANMDKLESQFQEDRDSIEPPK